MAEGGLRLIGADPAGPVFLRALMECAKPPCVVTSFEDARLRTLRNELGDELDVDLEILPFGQVLDRARAMSGLESRTLAPSGAVESLLRRILEVEADAEDPNPWSAWAGTPGGASVLASSLEDLRRAGFEPSHLRQAAAALAEDDADEARGLAELIERLEEALEGAGLESASSLYRRLLEADFQSSPALSRVIVVNGSEDRPLYEQSLVWMAERGVRVDLILSTLIDCPSAFPGSRRTAERLGMPIQEIQRMPDWRSKLFTSEPPLPGGPHMSAVRAPDELHEAEAALRGAYAAQIEGVEPHEMAVFCRSISSQGPSIELAAERLGIGVQMHRSAPLLGNGLARLVLELMKALAQPSPIGLISWVRGSYAPAPDVAEEAAALIQNSASAEDPWAWLESEAAGMGLAWLDELLGWRSKAQEPGGPALWRRRTQLLLEADCLTQAAEESLEAERDQGAQQSMMRSLAMATAGPESLMRPECGLAEWAEFAEEVWSRATYSVDTGRVGVRVVSDPSQLGRLKWLWVMGMAEGVFPRRRSQSPVLNDRLTAALNTLGAGWLPDSGAKALAERDAFRQVCSSGAERLVFSLTEPQAEEGAESPAFYVHAAARAAGRDVGFDRLPPGGFAPPEPEKRLPKEARLAEALEAGPRPFPAVMLHQDEARERVRRAPDEPYSASMLADAEECAFRAAALHILGWRSSGSRQAERLTASLKRRLGAARLRSQEFPARLEEEVDALLDRGTSGLPRELLRPFLIEAGWAFWRRELAARQALGRGPDEARHRPAPEDLDRKSGFQIRGRDRVAVDFELEEAYLAQGDAGAVLFSGAAKTRHKAPDLRFSESPFDPSQTEHCDLRTGMILAGLGGREGAALVELDSAGGQRIMVRARYKNTRRRLEPQIEGLKWVTLMADSPRDFYAEISARAERAMQAVDAADMAATPGAHCERCPISELCRRSSAAGEGEE
jgi:hypothetical protein